MRCLVLFVFLLLFFVGFGQFPSNYFSAPVKIPIALSGNFGEIRSGHFHAGLDIKTQGKEGIPIYASAEGYVSRIKVSLYGYGKALYVTHPNGYTTVYAHLKEFSPQIEAYIKKQQYIKKSFEIEVFPVRNALSVEKGEQIALSGNSGGSGGPHLHFEIRETKSEIPINPLLTNLPIADNIPPKLKTLGLYPLNEQSSINGENKTVYLPLTKVGNSYQIPANQKIVLNGKIGFGIEAIDNINGSLNRCGVYSIDLYKNNAPVYGHEMDKIGFHETRYINSHVDFYGWKKLKKRVQKSFLDPNNRLSVYKHIINRGQFFFLDDTTYQLKYEVKDVAGNTASLEFEVASTSVVAKLAKKEESTGKVFDFKLENFIENEWFTAQFPPYVFYDNIEFETEISAHSKSYVSPIFHLANLYTPMQSYFTLNVKLDSFPELPHDKLLVVALNDKLEVLAPEGGEVSNTQLTIKTRSLGPYAVAIDTVAPTITQLLTTDGTIGFEIDDELSRISTYKGSANGQWILFEYDRKTKKMIYKKDEYWPTNQKVELRIEVSDSRMNKTAKVYSF